MRLPEAVEPGRDGKNGARMRQHADLHGTDFKIEKHGVDLRHDEFRWHVMDRRNAVRVLRGQCGDDRGAVDAERRERFQVRLDAGAAARVGTRDGDGDGGHDTHCRFRAGAVESEAPSPQPSPQRGEGAHCVCGAGREALTPTLFP